MSTTDHGPRAATAARGAKTLRPLTYLAYAGGDAANNLAFSLAISFLALYLTDVAQLTPGNVALIFLLMRAVDAVTDVLMGSLIDRTRTRIGKFRPWILIGSAPLVVLAILNFSMPSSLYGTAGAMVWAVVFYFLLGSVAYTAVNIPYGSLAAAMTDNRTERSRLAVARSLGANLMQLVVAIAIAPAVNEHQGDPSGLQSAILSALIPLGVLAVGLYVLLVVTARENVPRAVQKVTLRDSITTLRTNRALQMLTLAAFLVLVGALAASGVMAYYARDVLGDARLIAVNQFLMTIPLFLIGGFIPRLVRRLGKPRLFQLGAAAGVVGGLLFFLASAETLWLAFAGAFLMGTANGVVNTLMWNMEADSIEYGELRTGTRNEGTTYAVFSFIRKAAQAVGGAAGLWVIGWFGYQGGAAAQSDSALTGISLAVGIIPALGMVLAVVVMQFYPMSDEQHRQILDELESRRSASDA